MFLIALILNSSTDDLLHGFGSRQGSKSRPTRFSKICAPLGRSCEEPNFAGLESRLRQEVLTKQLPTSKLFAFQRRFATACALTGTAEPLSGRPISGALGDLKELLQKALATACLPYYSTVRTKVPLALLCSIVYSSKPWSTSQEGRESFFAPGECLASSWQNLLGRAPL